MWPIIGIILGALAFLVVLVFAGFGFGFYGMIVKAKSNFEDIPDEKLDEYHLNVRLAERKLRAFPSEQVQVTTKDGLKLYGNFIRAEGDSKITILCLHGYT